MNKETLLVTVPIEENQLKELQEISDRLKVVTLDNWDKNCEDITIMYGWDKEVGNSILTSEDSQLKWLQAQSAGVDHINQQALKEKNILLTNASGVHGHQMSESILGMIFAHTRGIKEAVLSQEKKTWSSPKNQSDLNGKKAMIVGTGHIGERLAEILQVFQVEVTGVNRKGRQVPHFDHIVQQENIEEVIGEMDIVIGLLPDTEETHYFFNDELFSKMQDDVMFINAGRGGTAHTESLIKHCESQKIGFAGLDVFEVEPLPADSALWSLENVLITPHSSGATDQYYNRLFPIFVSNLKHFLDTSDVSVNKVN